jgi:hypothetical protein
MCFSLCWVALGFYEKKNYSGFENLIRTILVPLSQKFHFGSGFEKMVIL